MRDKNNQRLPILLLTLWGLLGLCFLVMSGFPLLVDYERFTTLVLQTVHKSDWRTYFQDTVLPLGRYQILPYLFGGLFFLWLIASVWIIPKLNKLEQQIVFFLQQAQQRQLTFWATRTPKEYTFLALIIGAALFRMLYYIHHYALQYDEAWTYNHFVSNGCLVSAVSPNNNHILYTLFACLTNILPIDGQYSLRLPVLLGGIVILFVFYQLLRQAFRSNWALLGLSFFAHSPAASLYSLYARGYIFQMLFTIIALSASWHLLVEKDKKNYYWTWWGIAHVLGLYSVPTHAYVLGLMSIYLVWKGRYSIAFLKSWLKATAVVVGCSLFLYAPYFLSNGIAVLWEAASQKAQGELLWTYQDKVSDWLLWGGGRGTPVYGFWLGLIAVLFFVYKNMLKRPTTKVFAELSLLFLLFPSLLNLSLGSQPPYRIWCFLSPFLALSFVLLGQQFAPKWQRSSSLLWGILILMTGYTWRLSNHYALQWSAVLDQQVKCIAEQLLEEEIQACYLFSNYDKPLLEYYYLRQNKRLRVKMASPQSKNFAPFEQLPLYQAVLWDAEDRISSSQERAWLEKHYPIVLYQDNRVQVHLPKY